MQWFLLLFSAVVACWGEFFPQRRGSRRRRRGAISLSLALARSRLTLYAHTPHARTLVVHRSRARTLLISCPPEATAGGSAPLIDRPNPFSPDNACATAGSANDFLFDDLLNLVKELKGRGKWGVNCRSSWWFF